MPAGTSLTSPTVSPVVQRSEPRTQVALTSTIGVLRVPKETVINGAYKMQIDLTAEVKIENDKYVLFDYQVNEYGIGDSVAEAQQDLMDSLVDLLTSLERREQRLANRELRDLDLLRKMLARI